MTFDYPGWRVEANGTWHRVRFHMFHYSEARNENHTHCGLVLNNPPFHDSTSELSLRLGPKSVDREPDPPCGECEHAYVLWKRDAARAEADRRAALL